MFSLPAASPFHALRPAITGFLVAALLFLLAACGAPLRADYLRSQAQAHDGAIAPGDAVTIVEAASGSTQAKTIQGTVAKDGTLDLGKWGKFQVSGSTPRSLRNRLAKVRDLPTARLQVNAQAPPAGRAFVFGKVSKPGRIALTQYSTLSAAVRQAEPSPELANVRKVRLLRGEVPNEREMVFNLTHIERGGVDPILMDGDILVVPATPLGEIFSPLQSGDETPQQKSSQAEASTGQIPSPEENL
ncbi:MAG TPA: hypothetical protein EYG26_00435 [Planctomycetes bacterium]|nr:hypothetical protein [Planctomycetota bacterium]